MTKYTSLRSEYHSFSSVYGPPARGYSKKNDMETFVTFCYGLIGHFYLQKIYKPIDRILEKVENYSYFSFEKL